MSSEGKTRGTSRGRSAAEFISYSPLTLWSEYIGPQKCGGEIHLWNILPVKEQTTANMEVINSPRNVAHNLLDRFQKKKGKKKRRAYRVAFDSPLKCISTSLYHPSCKGIGYILPSR